MKFIELGIERTQAPTLTLTFDQPFHVWKGGIDPLVFQHLVLELFCPQVNPAKEVLEHVRQTFLRFEIQGEIYELHRHFILNTQKLDKKFGAQNETLAKNFSGVFEKLSQIFPKLFDHEAKEKCQVLFWSGFPFYSANILEHPQVLEDTVRLADLQSEKETLQKSKILQDEMDELARNEFELDQKLMQYDAFTKKEKEALGFVSNLLQFSQDLALPKNTELLERYKKNLTMKADKEQELNEKTAQVETHLDQFFDVPWWKKKDLYVGGVITIAGFVFANLYRDKQAYFLLALLGCLLGLGLLFWVFVGVSLKEEKRKALLNQKVMLTHEKMGLIKRFDIENQKTFDLLKALNMTDPDEALEKLEDLSRAQKVKQEYDELRQNLERQLGSQEALLLEKKNIQSASRALEKQLSELPPVTHDELSLDRRIETLQKKVVKVEKDEVTVLLEMAAKRLGVSVASLLDRAKVGLSESVMKFTLGKWQTKLVSPAQLGFASQDQKEVFFKDLPVLDQEGCLFGVRFMMWQLLKQTEVMPFFVRSERSNLAKSGLLRQAMTWMSQQGIQVVFFP